MNNCGLFLQEHVSLCDKNTFAIGGPSRYYYAAGTTEEIRDALRLSHEKVIPLFVLGKGSNVLISDHGWPGLTLHLADTSVEGPISWDGATVTASGMAALNLLVKEAVQRGYAGMEELAGIPGTVGGAVIMNAGAFTSCIADTLGDITCCDRLGGEPLHRHASELGLSYRTSLLQKSGEIVLSARFVFSRTADPRDLERRRKEILSRRRKKQPLDFPNCGSVFKRPVGNFAGALIEKCGLKGEKCGGAEVSTKHANFIINTGDAKAGEVRRLICIVQKRVYEEYGVLLEPEVIFIGQFDEPLFTPP